MQYRRSVVAALFILSALGVGHPVFCQQGDSQQQRVFADFARRLSGVTLVGNFTLDGQTDVQLRKEEYVIRSVTKTEEADYWLFEAQIKYGKYDVTLPIPLQVKWAGKTPVITLDAVTIPQLGTFDARVVIDGNRYAGTWQHDQVGGHMFGTIKKTAAPKDDEPAAR